MSRAITRMTAAASVAVLGLLPVIGTGLFCASASAGPTQTDRTDEVANEQGGRLLLRLRAGVSIHYGADSRAELIGPEAPNGTRERLVLEGFPASCVRPIFDINAISDPELAREIGLDRYYVVEPADPEQRVEFDFSGVTGLEELVEYFQVDIRRTVHWSDAEPNGPQMVNDPDFAQQWGLRNTGQEIAGDEGRPGADIGAFFAWMLAGETEGITVAVLDAGVSPSHPDLAGQLVDGRNFSDGPADAWGHGFNDHGTRVSGVISAVHDNGLGIAGVSRGARIMSVRVLNDFNLAFPSDAAPGVVWAADNGADILNMSFGWNDDAPGGLEVLHDAIRYAHESGLLLVASTGNSSSIDVNYPAAFPEVIAVGATDNRDKLWANSTQGPEVSVVAPGKDILTLMSDPFDPDTLYGFSNGTSFAAPFVSGAAAVIWSEYPELTNEELRDLLQRTAVDGGPAGFDDSYGHGRVDLLLALLELDPGGAFGGPTCLGDFDGDGDIDLADLLEYLLLFGDGSFNADVAPPFGVLDFFDVLEFLARFAAGCGDGLPN